MQKLIICVIILFIFNIIMDAYTDYVKHQEYNQQMKLADEINDKHHKEIMESLDTIQNYIDILEKQKKGK